MTVIIGRRLDQWSTFDNDRRYLPTQRQTTAFTRIRPHASRHFAMYHTRIAQWYLNPIVRKCSPWPT